MKGIKMSDCRFYVNEEERVVVCVIPNTFNMLQDFICEHFQFPDFDLYLGLKGRLDDELYLPNSFMGKAVCSAEDEWNEELGRKIAFSRAKDKCYKSFFKRANKFVQRLDLRLNNIIDEFNTFGIKLEDKRKALEASIETSLKDENEP